jgi:hypothetical protein
LNTSSIFGGPPPEDSGATTSVITKKELIEKLKAICAQGWIPNSRPGNQGGVGNTVEDLLGIKENNLPIPNAAEWELKCQRKARGRSSYTTLFHLEPSPRAMRLVPSMLLPLYGWRHSGAGSQYPESELSFRQTINAVNRSDRGFCVTIDHSCRRVAVSFNHADVDKRHEKWMETVRSRVGLEELNPQPYWGFDDLFHVAATKLLNCFHLTAEVKRIDGKEHFHYHEIRMLEQFSQDHFIAAIESGKVLVDFDARTGHNHGTKFRLRQGCLPDLYDCVTRID